MGRLVDGRLVSDETIARWRAGPLVVISICNNWPLGFRIALLDPSTGLFRWFGISGTEESLYGGTAGLVNTPSGLVAVEQVLGGKSTILTDYSLQLEPTGTQILPDIADGHDLRPFRDGWVIADTGHDRVALVNAQGAAKTFWNGSKANTDTQHVNSVEVYDGRVLATAFGDKPQAGWRGSTNGYVVDCQTGNKIVTGIAQPHSLIAAEGSLWWCESATSAIWHYTPQSGAKKYATLNGYLRGLLVTPRYILVAASARRSKSRLFGIVLPTEAGGSHVPSSVLYVIDRDTSEVSASSLSHLGSEIFALCPAPQTVVPPTLDDTVEGLTMRVEAAAVTAAPA
jgi:hypothetical protein